MASLLSLNRLKLLIAGLFFLQITNEVEGQGQLALKVEAAAEHQDIVDRYLRTDAVADSTSGMLELKQMVTSLQQNGYLLASLDEVRHDSSSLTGQVYVGQQFEWGHLNISGLPKDLKRSVRHRSKKDILSGDGVERSFSKILELSNNSGFPFATVRLDSVSIVDAQVFATIDYDAGPLIRFDSLYITDSSIPRTRYLSSYLGIRPGGAYNERKVEQVPQYFETLPYYNLTTPVSLLFHNQNARVSFGVERVRANTFDGVIGFLPNSSREGGVLITGEVDLELLNLFESGKELRFHWQRLREETQYLDLSARVPHFLKSQLDLFGGYKQLKEDTTFINRNARIGFSMRISPQSDFNFFADFKSAGLLSTEELSMSIDPDNIDFDLTRYGVGYSYNTLSDKDLRDEGIRLQIEASIGNKKIKRNASLDQDIYSNLDLRSTFYQFEVAFGYQRSLSHQVTVYHQLSSGNIVNNAIFNNDMFRLGGLNSLRGFNENFFFAKNYILSNLELRLHFEESSFLYLFYDQAYLRTEAVDGVFSDTPGGIGAGLQIRTDAGDLKLAYALGRSDAQSFNFNQSKIHFGLVSRF